MYFERPQERQALVVSSSRWVSVQDEMWLISTLVVHPRQNNEVTTVTELGRSLKSPFWAN